MVYDMWEFGEKLWLVSHFNCQIQPVPFKLIFFVLVDGWYMICRSLVKSYGL